MDTTGATNGESALPTDGATALDLLPEAVVVVDGGRIAHVNERANGLLSLDGDAVGQPLDTVLDLVDDAGNPCARTLAHLDRDVERLAEQILRVRLPDGRVRPVAVSGRPLGGGGLVLTFRHAGRRERLDAARSDLVATVSHEIRSPLSSVKGFTRTLLAKWERFSDDQKHTMLETINADADRVTRLLTELLDVSRIDAGRVQIRRQRIDLDETVRGVVEKARHRPEGSGREIDLDLAGPLPTVMADPDKIEQILTNLVENALKYAPDSPVRIEGESDTDTVWLRIVDHGPGIPGEMARRIFEKFGRGRDDRRSGTGLGLYITRGLARAHGGDVWCESTEGEGSVFHLQLPCDPDPAELE